MIFEAKNQMNQLKKKALFSEEEESGAAERSRTKKQHLPKVFGGVMKSNSQARAALASGEFNTVVVFHPLQSAELK